MIEDFFDTIEIPKLQNEYSYLLEKVIDKREIAEAITALSVNTAPGHDGFTTEFYEQFSDI